MCSSKAKASSCSAGVEASDHDDARINGRPVLQPSTALSSCNRVPLTLERRNSLKKITTPPPPPPPTSNTNCTQVANNYNDSENYISGSASSTRPAALKRTAAASSTAIATGTGGSGSSTATGSRSKSQLLDRKKSKSFKESSTSCMFRGNSNNNNNISASSHQHHQEQLLPVSSSPPEASLSYSSSLIVESPGSIAAVRREHMALQSAQRKMRIAHYGRSKSAKFLTTTRTPPTTYDAASINCEDAKNDVSSLMLGLAMYSSTPKVSGVNVINNDITRNNIGEEVVLDHRFRRCSFITPNSDPLYITYHDQEWGVPVHDDRMLFELLVLSGAQVGSDWVSILRKRQDFRDAFSGFDPEIVASISDKQMQSISEEYGIDISRVRGVVDNSNRILEIKKEFGTFDKYIWGFVNKKPICTQYKFGNKVPVKTSKSESISKDMIRRGFRFVGPTVVHSFMQAAGLTNDHLVTCHRHPQCALLAAAPPRP